MTQNMLDLSCLPRQYKAELVVVLSVNGVLSLAGVTNFRLNLGPLHSGRDYCVSSLGLGIQLNFGDLRTEQPQADSAPQGSSVAHDEVALEMRIRQCGEMLQSDDELRVLQ